MSGSLRAPPGTTAATLRRLEAEAVPAPFPAMVERALRKLHLYPGWEHRMRDLLRTSSLSDRDPNPSGWAATAMRKTVNAMRAVLQTAIAAGLPCADFADLQAPEVLDALERRLVLKRSAEDPCLVETQHALPGGKTPLPRTWNGVYLAGNMSSLQTCLHAMRIASSPDLKARIKFYKKSERRSYDDRLFHKETYMRAAAALDAFGRIAQAAGHERGSRLRTGAALLAVAAEGSPRRGELAKSDRTLVVPSPFAERPQTRLFIRGATSKARRPRILWLRHSTAIRLMDDLRAGPGGNELFRRPDGRAYSVSSLDCLLREVTALAVGHPANYNMLRRANARAQDTSAGRSAQLGRSAASTQTNAIYYPGLVHGSHSVLARARAKARKSAVRAGCIGAVAHRAAEPAETAPRPVHQRSPTALDASPPSRLGLRGKPRRAHDLTGTDPKLRQVYRRCRAHGAEDWRGDLGVDDPEQPHTHLWRPAYGFGDMRDGATN